jgi:hypothetical protein
MKNIRFSFPMILFKWRIFCLFSNEECGFLFCQLSLNFNFSVSYSKWNFLKVLSSETDSAKIRFIRLVVKKVWGADIFRKIHQSPMLLEPFKATAPSHKAVGYWYPNCQQRTQTQLCPCCIKLLATALWTNLGAVSTVARNILNAECCCSL